MLKSFYLQELPNGWEVFELQDLCHKVTDGTHKTPAYQESGVRFISIKNIRPFQEINWDCYKKFITREAHEKLIRRCHPEYDDILFPRIGTLGFAKRVDFKETVSIFVGLGLLKPIKDVILPKYLEYYMNTPFIYELSHKKATGSGRLTLPLAESRKFPVPLAPINEQDRIVAEIEKQFSRLDEAVENLKRVKANLKRYKASVLKAAVEGNLTEEWRAAHPDVEPAEKLLERILAERRKKWEEAELAKMRAKGKVPKDDKWKKKYKEPAKPDLNDLPILPKEWKWVTWDTILEFDKGAFKRGPFGSSLKKSIFVDSGYKVYEQYCPINDDCSFARYFITDEKYNELKAFAVQAKDFLISCSGVTLGRITQVPDDYDEGVINQALLRVRLNNNIFDDSFFKMLFRSPYFQKQIFKNATGSAIPNVKGVNELKAIPLPLPIFEEQREIITILEEYMSVIFIFDREVDKNLKRAERLRQSILKKAFSGKLLKIIAGKGI